jgi:beta-aspartyl-peptidase (threonine type)
LYILGDIQTILYVLLLFEGHCPSMTRPALIVHGGAGDISVADHAACMAGTSLAARTAWQMLEAGASALHAVEAAVRILEDDPIFDSGRGSVLNAVGEIELDALIMDGATLNMGAVICVQGVANPITLARLIMTDTPHNILSGEGARAFARQKSIPLVSSADLTTPQTLANFQAWQKSQLSGSVPPTVAAKGTCGAVALDVNGHVAAATSTGGKAFKLPGRVGDSPLVGSGAYADDRSGAASATGDGEYIMRVVLSKTATDAIASGLDAQAAADHAVRVLVERVGGEGALILVDHNGHIGFAHSTSYISVAWVAADGSIQAAMQSPGRAVNGLS